MPLPRIFSMRGQDRQRNDVCGILISKLHWLSIAYVAKARSRLFLNNYKPPAPKIMLGEVAFHLERRMSLK
jgi:hypothetical protein